MIFIKHIAIAISSTLLLATAHAQPVTSLSDGRAGGGGRIEFQSTTPADRYALLRNNTARISQQVVWGELVMPNAKNMAAPKIPAVVISHGSEGIASPGHDTYTDLWTKSLNDAGIAVFMVDSFTPRRLGNMSGAAMGGANVTANISDALHALKLLASHPQIDASKIFHIGMSMGGNAAIDAAMPALGQHILPAGLRWAGSVAMYPGCNMRWRTDHLGASSPILMLLGERDDNTPAAPCVDYAATLAKDGNPVSAKVYAGAGHDFDRRETSPRSISHGIFDRCDIEVKIAAQSGMGTAVDQKTNKTINGFEDLSAAIRSCYRMAAVTIAGHRAAREQSVRDVMAFIAANSK